MIPVEEAIRIVLQNTPCLGAETIPLTEALGRILAQRIVSDTDLPPFNRSIMDGFALRSEDLQSCPVRLKIVGESAAGKAWSGRLSTGEAVRIMTGAAVPEGADSVQKVELTSEINSEMVEILEPTSAGQFITPRSSEITAGELVLSEGEVIRPASIPLLASFGFSKLSVGKRPRLSVLATGSELVKIEESPGPYQIRDSNTHSICAYARVSGAEVIRTVQVEDNPARLKKDLESALCDSDIVVLTGGVSMGAYDYTRPVMAEIGISPLFERVSLKPGKPTVFGMSDNRLVFGLPGNPVSAVVTFSLFVRTAILKQQGATSPNLRSISALLASEVRGAKERASYLPSELTTSEDGHLLIKPLRWSGSSDFVPFSRAKSLIVVPEGIGVLPAGTVVKALLLPE
jgi:molybdopterin molybdotransferase